jgi:hypothetical protein
VLWAIGRRASLTRPKQSDYFNEMPANDRVACTQFHFGHDKKLKAKVTVAVPRQKIFRAYDVVMEPSPTSFDRTEAQHETSSHWLLLLAAC